MIDWLETGAREAGEAEPFPRGVSERVKQRARDLFTRYGAESLPQWIKMHFKTAREIQGLPVGEPEE